MLVVIVIFFLSRTKALFNILSRGDYRLLNKIPFDQIEECVIDESLKALESQVMIFAFLFCRCLTTPTPAACPPPT